MPQDGEINLSEAKARYSIKDVFLVDSRELEFANEFRTTFEISFGIGLTLLGVLITNFGFLLLLITLVFLLFGVANLFRYKQKEKSLREITPKN